MIDMALPDSVQGVVTGETAGYTLNQAAHLASLQWSPIVDNVEVCLSERTGWESWLIENRIGETVYVWGSYPQPRRRPGQPIQFKDGWMGIGPKELKGVHLYEVKIDPANVNNEALKLRNIEMKLNLRLIAPDMAVREAGYDPIEVERKWLLHELKNDPEVRGNLKQRIFQGLATIDQQKMQDVPPGGEPQGPQAPQALQPNVPQGVAPGVTPEGFAPPFPAAPTQTRINEAVQPGQPGAQLGPGGQPQGPPMAPGTLPGQPGGIRGVPTQHLPLPGGG
jgi:hypothetical protein